MDVLLENPPELTTEAWLNTPQPIRLADLKGQVVALHAFQMLCPGCVSHGLPQAVRIQRAFSRNNVTVIGLHTVFEHHDVMTRRALEAFVHEYGWSFPIGIDKPASQGDIPHSMAAYGMRGTPSLLLFDHQGRLRHHEFGRPDDMLVGARIMALLIERENRIQAQSTLSGNQQASDGVTNDCADGKCVL